MSQEEKPEMVLPRLNENMFLKQYLAKLLDNENPDAKKDWVKDITGNPLLRAEVVDDNDHEKVLFWVPPMMYSCTTTVGSNIDTIADQSLDVAKRLGARAVNNHLAKNLKGVFIAAEPPEEDIAQWKMILERYGLLAKTAGSSVGKGKEPVYEDEDEEEW